MHGCAVNREPGYYSEDGRYFFPMNRFSPPCLRSKRDSPGPRQVWASYRRRLLFPLKTQHVAELYDAVEIAAASARSGTATIPLVKALREQVGRMSPSAADFVHWGATSQDVADTAIVLLLKQARSILQADLARLEGALYRLSEQHAHTVILGRTRSASRRAYYFWPQGCEGGSALCVAIIRVWTTPSSKR